MTGLGKLHRSIPLGLNVRTGPVNQFNSLKAKPKTPATQCMDACILNR